MNKFLIIIKHTYMKHLKSKSFWASTIVSLILITFLTNMNNIFGNEVEKKNDIAVTGEASLVNEYKKIVDGKSKNLNVKIYKDKKDYKEKGKYALLTLNKKNEYGIAAKLETNETNNKLLLIDINSSVNELNKKIKLKKYNLNEKELNELNETIKLEIVDIKKARDEIKINKTLVVVFVGIMLIYASVVFYGNAIATEVASEKSSRIMEVLVSSADPKKHMFGKILGLALLNMTQYLIYSLVFIFNLKDKKEMMSDIPLDTVLYGIIFVTLGYFFYSTLLATMGSLVNRVEDVQQFIAPINIIIVIGFIVSIIGFIDPQISAVVVSSYIPFFSPMTMFLRASIGEAGAIEIIISITLMIASIIWMMIMSAKIYKGGVLNYSKFNFKNIKSIIKK